LSWQRSELNKYNDLNIDDFRCGGGSRWRSPVSKTSEGYSSLSHVGGLWFNRFNSLCAHSFRYRMDGSLRLEPIDLDGVRLLYSRTVSGIVRLLIQRIIISESGQSPPACLGEESPDTTG